MGVLTGSPQVGEGHCIASYREQFLGVALVSISSTAHQRFACKVVGCGVWWEIAVGHSTFV